MQEKVPDTYLSTQIDCPSGHTETLLLIGEAFFRLHYTQDKENLKMNMIINFGAFAILTILWLGFAAALIFNQAMLDTAWQMLRGLPFVIQAVVWLLILPVAAGLWIWKPPGRSGCD